MEPEDVRRRSDEPVAEGASSEQRARDVFAFTVEVAERGDLRWAYFGPNSATVFGRSVGTGAPLPDLLEKHTHPEDLPAARHMLDAARSAPTEVELRIIGGDDATRWISWRLVPRPAGGRLFVDGVATEITARQALSRSRAAVTAELEQERRRDVAREYAAAIRDAHDEILQRLFAAGLRLQLLRSRLNDGEAHAAAAIGFQLDQAVADLRELVKNLDAASRG